MRPPRSFVILACLLGGALALAGWTTGCGSGGSAGASAGSFSPRTPGVLSVTTSEIPSAGFWDGTRTHVTGGVEYGLAKALAAQLGLDSVHVGIVPFSRIVGGDLGGADVALAEITPTSERSKVLSFSTSYLDAAPTILVRRGTSVADLKSARKLRWGVEPSTTFHKIVEQSIAPNRPPLHFNTRRELINALLSGRVDAILRDLPDAVAVADKSRGRLKAAAQLPISEGLAVALPHDSDNVEAVSSAVRALVADGTIDKLVRRWIGPAAADPQHHIPLLRTTR